MGARSLRPRALALIGAGSAILVIASLAVAGCTAILGLDKDFQELPSPAADAGGADDASSGADTYAGDTATNEPDGSGADAEPGVNASPHRDAGFDSGRRRDGGRFDGGVEDGGPDDGG